MIKRSTWVTVVLLAVLAGLAYYLQQPDNLIKKALTPAGTPTAEALGTLIAATDGPINGISLQSANGQSVSLDHKSAGWILLINGETTPADQTAGEQAASGALSLRLIAKVDSASNLSAFGLDQPAYIYKLTLANGKSVTFKIGKPTITGSGYYLQKEDGSVVVVDKYGMDLQINLLNQPPYMFTPTPSSVPVTETPTPSETITGTVTPPTELTPTKQP